MRENTSILIVIGVVTAANALSPMAMHIFVPALPAVRDSFDASIADTQWVVSAYSIVLAIAMLVYGPLSDALGRRRLLIGGLVVFCAASLLGYFAMSIWALVLCRAIQGAGVASAAVISRAIAADLFSPEELGRVLSYMTMALVIAPMLAPLLSGYLVGTVGWRSIFLLLLACGIVVVLLVALFLPGASVDSSGHSAGKGSGFSAAPFLARDFLARILILFAAQVGVFAFIAASPYLIIERFGYSATAAGLVFIYLTIGYMLGNWFAALSVKRFGNEGLLRFATVIYSLGAIAAVLVAMAGAPNIVAVVAPAVLLTFTNGISQPICMSAAISSVPDQRGSAAGITGFVQIMAGAVGLQVMGMLPVYQFGSVALVISICAVLAWIGVLMAPRRPG